MGEKPVFDTLLSYFVANVVILANIVQIYRNFMRMYINNRLVLQEQLRM